MQYQYQILALRRLRRQPCALALQLVLGGLVLTALESSALAQPAVPVANGAADGTLAVVEVSASADASAEGLTKNYAGKQVARGGRVGLLGSQDLMNAPFSTTAYTSELIKDQQAQGVADVLLNDPTVRASRGFGNFQELYMIRGFPVPSDDMTYNGLYGLLPRQYVAAELVERVEVLRGANAVLNGGTGAASGFGVGGTVNILPKRAGNEPLSQVTVGVDNGGQTLVSTDIARRFGPDRSTGIRVNAARREGNSMIKSENRELSLLSVGADYRGRDVRLSADVGHQDNRINAPRPSVTPNGGIPDAPGASTNYAQPWTYSKERSTFASARAEFDLSDSALAWAAAGLRSGTEENRLANPSATPGGSTSAYRFDNVRKDEVRTAEVGLRTKFSTGEVQHIAAVSAAGYQMDSRNAYAFSNFAGFANNLYEPTAVAMPDANFFTGGSLSDPQVTERTYSSSVALADTLSFAQERLRLTLGVRQQRLYNTTYNYNSGAQDSEYDKSRVTPMAALVFRLKPQVSLYANYIEGLTKGDTAAATSGGQPVTNAGQSLAPYVARQQEIGVKYDGGNIGGGAALFSTAKPFGLYDGSNTFVDGGEQRNQGLELSVFGEPRRGLRLLGGLTLLDAKITSSQGGSLNGNSAIGVPSQQLNLGADVDVPGVQGLALSARVVHTGSQYADANNTMTLPAWTRLDLGARYATEIGAQIVTLRARLDNATDRAYWASAGGYPGASYLVQGAPRTLTVSATVDF